MKDKQYKDKALRRHLWERKAVEYGVECETMLKWYSTQRTRYSKLKEGQQIRKTQKRDGDGLSSDDETEHFISIEISETDSDRDRFIRRIFGFLKPHIRRHKKDTPATFKDKLALAQTGELAGSDDGSLVEEPKLPTKKYTGCPTPRQSSSSRSKSSTETRTVTPYTGNRVSSDIQDKLVQFITRDNPESRSSPFCKYLENELDRLHDACLEPAYDEITTVLNHYRKVSRQFKMREATGNQVSPLEDVPSAFNSQLPHQQRPRPLVPASTVNIPRVSQLQQEGALASGTNLSSVRSTPLPEFVQSGPRQWNINQPQSSVWRPQDCGYVEQSQQYSLEQTQQQQYHTLQPTQGFSET